VLGILATPAAAQTFEVAGARAAGMGGAFVAVADDASAVYWNPAGLAMGAFFSGVIDYNSARANREGDPRAGSQSATFLGIGMPALGLTYYRLRATTVESQAVPAGRLDVPRTLDGADVARGSSLISHHLGVTLVQSLTDSIAIGTTLKAVRGVAATALVAARDRDDQLDDADDLVGSASTEFDADIGVMAVIGTIRAGLTVRNVREPEFDVPDGTESLTLHRQVRAGIAMTPTPQLLVSADLDLRSVPGTAGLVRNFAAGAEARVHDRALVRGGFRLNTKGDQPGGRAPVGTVGGSYAIVSSVYLDGQATFGSDQADRGWGLGARVVF
jgi:F plasmid transfer operon, TraF, protein